MDRLTVFACESQPIVVEGLAKVLAGCEDLELLGAVTSMSDALDAVRQHRPDLILVDQTFGPQDGLPVYYRREEHLGSLPAGAVGDRPG